MKRSSMSKLLKEWKNFLNENSREPEEGYYDDEYNPGGYDPDADLDDEPEEGYYDDEYNPDGYDPDADPEERYGQYHDPEDPSLSGRRRVPRDPDMSEF